MDPLTVAGLAQAQIANAGAVGNPVLQGITNRKQRKYSTEMYERQKRDNLEFWRMQNEYNDPSNQMARLKAAGLNPNMVYGNGSAANTAGEIKAAQTQQWNPRAPQLDLQGTSHLRDVASIQNSGAQTENLKANNAVIFQEAALKAAQVANLGIKNAQDKLQLNLAEELRETTIETAKAGLDQLIWQRNLTEEQTSHEGQKKEVTLSTLKTMAQNRELTEEQKRNVQVNIGNAEKEGILKDLEIQMRRVGINPNDPIYMRILTRIFNAIMEKVAPGTLKTIFNFK